MKVAVRLLGLDQETRNAVESHVRDGWDAGEVVVEPEAQPFSSQDGLLIVGSGPESAGSDALMTEFAEAPTGKTGDPLDDLFFQIDAKLGRLTKSHLVKDSTRTSLGDGSKLSRRELLLGVSSGFRRVSDAPVFFEESCEARYGCTKCVDVCPHKALTLAARTISVSDKDCTRCGLCAAACPVGAVQMPRFSEAAYLGLLNTVDQAKAPKKTLVLTCNQRSVVRQAGMDVEEVAGVGVTGPRQLAMAAASSLGGVAVYCADGLCEGKDSARRSAEAISQAVAGGDSPVPVSYAEGKEGAGKLAELYQSSQTRATRLRRGGEKWKDYVATLKSLSGAESLSHGLGLTKMTISDRCTLCGACVKTCPHLALRADGSSLFFDASACTGCGSCATVCPEHSVALSPADQVLPEILKEVRVYEDDVFHCQRCGAPVGSAKFVNKVSTMLGPGNEFVKYCEKCKQRVILDRLTGGNGHG